MKRSTPFFVIFLLALASGLAAQDSIQHQTDFPPEEFQERRAQVFDEVGDNALVLLQGAPNVRGFRVFRQSNEFYYLTGVEVAHAYLLMDGSKGTTRLYLPHRNARRERGEGKKMSVEDAELALELTGVDEVHGIEALPHHLWRYLLRAPFPKLYTMLSPAEGAAQSRDELLIGFADAISDPWDGATSREGDFVGQIKSRYPQFEIADLTPILDDMRIVKSAREIQLIRRASQLAADGIMEAMRSTEPGLYEYQLDAVARFVFLTNGARGEAYRSITATGTNAFFGHYNRNDSELVAGDLILMDYAPDYRYYVSDVTRMWPVSGKFTADQRELYSWILRYYEELIEDFGLVKCKDLFAWLVTAATAAHASWLRRAPWLVLLPLASAAFTYSFLYWDHQGRFISGPYQAPIYGPVFWYSAGLAWVLTVIGSGHFLAAASRFDRAHPIRIAAVALGSTAPVIGNMLYVTGVIGTDPTPLLIGASGVALRFALIDTGLSAMLHQASDAVFERLRTGVLLADLEGRLHQLEPEVQVVIQRTGHRLVEVDGTAQRLVAGRDAGQVLAHPRAQLGLGQDVGMDRAAGIQECERHDDDRCVPGHGGPPLQGRVLGARLLLEPHRRAAAGL